MERYQKYTVIGSGIVILLGFSMISALTATPNRDMNYAYFAVGVPVMTAANIAALILVFVLKQARTIRIVLLAVILISTITTIFLGLALVPALRALRYHKRVVTTSYFRNESNESFQEKFEAKSNLKPKLCHKCLENKSILEFRSMGELCLNCFEKEYGKILLQTSEAKYDGGHKAHELTGIVEGRMASALTKVLGKNAISGKMFLTENYFIFANDGSDLSKKWEIIIPLGSVILYWELEEKMRQKYGLGWEATSTDSFGFGSSFIRPKKGFDSQAIPYRLLIPYADNDKQIQEPEFKLDKLFIQKWAADLFKMVIKTKVVSQQDVSKDDIFASNIDMLIAIPVIEGLIFMTSVYVDIA